MWMRRWQPRALAIAELAAVTMSLCFLGTPHGAFAQALVRSEASHRPRLADSTEARALASSDSSNSSRAHHVMVGAAIGVAAVIVLDVIHPGTCSGPSGETPGLCPILKAQILAMAMVAGAILGAVAGAPGANHYAPEKRPAKPGCFPPTTDSADGPGGGGDHVHRNHGNEPPP